MYFRAPSQQKTHNFPFQCGTNQDDPKVADTFEHKDVKDGDVVLLFSDGFQDNVYDSGIQ